MLGIHSLVMVVEVSRPEEAAGAGKQTLVMLRPTEAAIAPRGLRNEVHIHEQRPDHSDPVSHEDRGVLVGEHHRLGSIHLIGIVRGVVHENLSGGLAVEPLAGDPLVGTCTLREDVCRERPRPCQMPVETELVPQHDTRCQCRAGEVSHHLHGSGFDGGLIGLCALADHGESSMFAKTMRCRGCSVDPKQCTIITYSKDI